ncbi:hypothetical protein OH687_28705 [Burkholderia anthina]|nr:hypothetical protein OH687_28705 [Burkholderia anthina]
MGTGAIPLPGPAPVGYYDQASRFHAEWLLNVMNVMNAWRRAASDIG